LKIRQIEGSKASQFLKFFMGPAFFAWMVHSGRLNLHQVSGGLSHWQPISAMIVLLCIQSGITACR
jgi:hypothetical protein